MLIVPILILSHSLSHDKLDAGLRSLADWSTDITPKPLSAIPSIAITDDTPRAAPSSARLSALCEEDEASRPASPAYLNFSTGFPDALDRKSTRLNSSHSGESRMPSSA